MLQVSDLSSQSSNILARKLSVKLAQRVGLTLLVTQERTWGMGSAVSSLDSNLSRERAAGDPEGGEGGEERSGGPEDGEGEYVVAEEVEDVIQLLLQVRDGGDGASSSCCCG